MDQKDILMSFKVETLIQSSRFEVMKFIVNVVQSMIMCMKDSWYFVCGGRGVVLLNCAGAMNRKGLAQDGLALRLVAPIFVLVEYLLQQRKIANFLFNK